MYLHIVFHIKPLSFTVKPVLSGHSKREPKIVFQDRLSLNAGQKYCRMLPLEHSAILLTFIKLPSVIKIFVLSAKDRFHCSSKESPFMNYRLQCIINTVSLLMNKEMHLHIVLNVKPLSTHVTFVRFLSSMYSGVTSKIGSRHEALLAIRTLMFPCLSLGCHIIIICNYRRHNVRNSPHSVQGQWFSSSP